MGRITVFMQQRNLKEHQKQKNNVSTIRDRPVYRADKLTAICESIV
jgi:hypothetical protein